MGDEQRGPSTVSKITAEVLYGSDLHKFHFQLRFESTDDGVSYTHSCGDDGINQHFHSAVNMLATKSCKEAATSMTDPTSILGHVYAEETFRAAEKYGLKSGMDIK
eukprot:174868-Ditylum_brightwellii.AAC.1